MSGSIKGFLNKTIDAFEKGKAFALRQVGNEAIDEAALQNSRRMAQVALVAYCLHKLYSKEHVVRHEKWGSVKSRISSSLRKAAKALGRGKGKGFEKRLGEAVSSVRKVDSQLGNYVQGLYDKARVKYASSAYALGLGLGQAAALTGADKKDVLRYVGVTKVHDREGVTMGIRERLARLKKRMGEGK